MEHCSCLATHTPHGSYCDTAGTIKIIAADSTSDSATALLTFPCLSLRLCLHCSHRLYPCVDLDLRQSLSIFLSLLIYRSASLLAPLP